MNLKIQLLPALVAMLFSSSTFAGISKFRCDTIPGRADSLLIKLEPVEEEISFPDGEKTWQQYLQMNIDTSITKKNKAPTGTYTVVVQFVLDKEGYVSDVRALSNHGYGMEEEVIRAIIKRRNASWTPAKQNAKIVHTFNKQSFTFHVEGKKKKKRNKDD